MPPSPSFKPEEEGNWSLTPETGAAPNGLAGGQPPRLLTTSGAAGKMGQRVTTGGAGRSQSRWGPAQGRATDPHPTPLPCPWLQMRAGSCSEAASPTENRRADNPPELQQGPEATEVPKAQRKPGLLGQGVAGPGGIFQFEGEM